MLNTLPEANFAQIPQAIRHILAGEPQPGLPELIDRHGADWDTVILFLIDGFGWELFSRYADQLPFLRRFVEAGSALKIASQFPSTTAAQMTTLHTGLPISQSGVPEWLYYEPLLDRVFAPLLYKTREAQGTGRIEPALAEQLFPTETLYSALSSSSVRSYCVQSRSYAHSPFSKRVCRGAAMRPFRTMPEAIANLPQCTPGSKNYVCVYFDVIDMLSHSYGPDGAPVDAELRALFSMLETLLMPKLSKRTLLLLTADHGHTEIDREQTIFIDREVPDLLRWSKKTRSGHPIGPAGGRRDLFLHLEAPYLDEAFGRLSQALEGRATVARTERMIEEGYFGQNVSQRLRDRLGDLLVLPAPHRAVWWSTDPRFDPSKKKGDHGGLSPEEMEIPLLAFGEH